MRTQGESDFDFCTMSRASFHKLNDDKMVNILLIEQSLYDSSIRVVILPFYDEIQTVHDKIIH